VNNTIIVAVVVSLLAAFVPLDKLIDMVSIGTLTAFIVVSIGVVILAGARNPTCRADSGSRLLSRHAPCSRCWPALHFCSACTGTPGSPSAHGFWSCGRLHARGGTTVRSTMAVTALIASAAPGIEDVEIVTPKERRARDGHRRVPPGQGRHLRAAPRRGSRPHAQDVTRRRHGSCQSRGRTVSPARIDAEYAQYADKLAADSAGQAKECVAKLDPPPSRSPSTSTPHRIGAWRPARRPSRS